MGSFLYGGKLQVVNVVLPSLPIFFLSYLKVYKWVIEEVDKVISTPVLLGFSHRVISTLGVTSVQNIVENKKFLAYE